MEYPQIVTTPIPMSRPPSPIPDPESPVLPYLPGPPPLVRKSSPSPPSSMHKVQEEQGTQMPLESLPLKPYYEMPSSSGSNKPKGLSEELRSLKEISDAVIKVSKKQDVVNRERSKNVEKGILHTSSPSKHANVQEALIHTDPHRSTSLRQHQSPRLLSEGESYRGPIYAPTPKRISPPQSGGGMLSVANGLVGASDSESAHSMMWNVRPLYSHWNIERVIRAGALFYHRHRGWLRPLVVIGCACACVGVAALALAVLI